MKWSHSIQHEQRIMVYYGTVLASPTLHDAAIGFFLLEGRRERTASGAASVTQQRRLLLPYRPIVFLLVVELIFRSITKQKYQKL